VLLVEDDDTTRSELCAILDAEPDFEVVGAFGDGESAVAWDGAFDLAIVDLGLPGMPGSEVIRLIASRQPDVALMAHTVFEESRTVFEAIVAGASSYVLKGLGRAEMLDAIRELRAGGAPMSPRIAREVVLAFQRQGKVADRYVLSGRERQVLRCLEDGQTYKEIAAELGVSPHTVHTHIKRIYEKLHASGKADALAKARLRGML